MIEENKKLAHIERITNIEPIYNKKGEKMRNLSATVLGWQTMIRPNEFNIGDLVVYVEVGSIMPKENQFKFLEKYNYRVKTQKFFQGSYTSQGLILPLSILPKNTKIEEGKDVTKELGIIKYYTKQELKTLEEEERQRKRDKNKLKKFMMKYSWFRRLFLSKNQIKGFPYWVSKSDEEKLQNFPHVLEQFKDKNVYITEKVDYQSVTFTGKMIPRFNGIFERLPFKKYQFVVCSRNMINNNKSSLYWQIAKKYNIKEILKENPHLTIQGEQGDTKVQGNKYNITEPTMWVFNIIDHERNYHYNITEIIDFCEKYNLNYVPPIAFGFIRFPKLKELGTTVQEFIELSKGQSLINPEIPREGIVVRCVENGKKIISFKVVNPDFEIKFNK